MACDTSEKNKIYNPVVSKNLQQDFLYERKDTKMKKNLTEMVFILDMSGSMSGLENDTIGGFNSMIEKQKKEEGEAYVTTIVFSNDSKTIHDRVPVEKIGKMTDRDYRPGGCTALIDAIGDAVRHVENIHKYAREEDVPEKTVFVITTDGEENASRKYTAKEIKKMVKTKKEKNGWEFLFLGANIDAVETAAIYGIDEERAVTFRCDAQGTRLNYETVGNTIASMRSHKIVHNDWKKDIEDYEKNSKK